MDPGRGRPYEGSFTLAVVAQATGELAMVFVQLDGTVSQTWDQRFRLASGYLEMPVFGFPDGPVGLASFSLEEPASDDGRRLIPSDAVITETTWPLATTTLGAVHVAKRKVGPGPAVAAARTSSPGRNVTTPGASAPPETTTPGACAMPHATSPSHAAAERTGPTSTGSVAPPS